MTAAAALARCTEPGCPWRWRSAGPDRLCPWHGADDTSADLTTRASGFSVRMTAFDGGEREASEELSDHESSRS